MIFISKIEENYGEMCICCYDKMEGDKIGLHWNPRSFIPQKITTDLLVKRKLHMTSILGDDYEVPNIISILNDIEKFEISQNVLESIELIKI